MVLLPLYDQDPLERNTIPFVTYGLIAVNIAVFLIELGLDPSADVNFVKQFALIPVSLPTEVSSEGVLPTALTFVTYTFIHGGWLHIGGNMLFLWVFGDNIEDAMGHGRFLVFYLLCGAAGGLAYVLSAPSAVAPLVGASGAIAGVVAAYLMLRPCARIEVFLYVFPVALPAYWVLGGWIMLQVVNILEHTDDGIAWWTHVGGLLAGAFLTPFLRRADVRLFECMRPPRVAPTSTEARKA